MTTAPQETLMTPGDQVSLRDYLERLITEHDRRYSERFEAQEKAIRVALAAHNRTVWIVGSVLAILQVFMKFLRLS